MKKHGKPQLEHLETRDAPSCFEGLVTAQIALINAPKNANALAAVNEAIQNTRDIRVEHCPDPLD